MKSNSLFEYQWAKSQELIIMRRHTERRGQKPSVAIAPWTVAAYKSIFVMIAQRERLFSHSRRLNI